MFLHGTKLESVDLSLSPSEYLQEIERKEAQSLLDRVRVPHTEWEIRDGFPQLIKIDRAAYEAFLRQTGLPAEKIKSYVDVIAGPEFNKINRRGIEKLRKRLAACRDVAIKLWGPAQVPLQAVPVGVAMLDYLNAGACPVPAGGNAIVMNLGLAFFFDFFILVIQTQQAHGGSPPPDALAELSRLAKAIFGDSRNRQEFVTAFPRSLQADGDIMFQARIKMARACLFVLLHEYGHVALGHTDQLRKWPHLGSLPPNERRKYLATMRGWEFEADRFALDTLAGKMAAPGSPLPGPKTIRLTITDVFGIMAQADGLRSVESPDDTHPLPKQRLFRLIGVKDDAEFIMWLSGSPEDPPESKAFTVEMLGSILAATGDVVDNGK